MKPFTLDLTHKLPRLSWLNAKTRPQMNYGRKNASRHLPEHIAALKENDSFVPTPKPETPSQPVSSGE